MAVNWWEIAIPAATAATGAYLSSRNARKGREADAEQAELDREASRGSNILDVASRESLADPFRQQLSQGNALTRLDLIRNASLNPTRVSAPAEMQRFVPQVSGGFNYTPSQDLRTSAKLLQQSIARGETAPTMTNPANYGRTAALNLNQPGVAPAASAGSASMPGGTTGAVPRHAGAAGVTTESTLPPLTTSADGDDSQFDDADDFYAAVMPEYERRGKRDSSRWDTAGSAAMAGSVAAGPYAPVVAGVGALMKAFGRTAKTAPTDFELADAQDLYRRAGEEFLDPQHEREEEEITPEELDAAIRSQGWEDGDRWVGEQGLFQILNQLAASPEANAARQRKRLANQPAGSPYAGLFA